MTPRPEGFDYSKPDPEEIRCKWCNPNGMNRTGLMPIRYYGNTSSIVESVVCPNRCKNGLVDES